jgi:ABC-type transport system substrate-binding protein
MKRSSYFVVFLVIVMSMVMASCAPSAKPGVKATYKEIPFEPMSVSAPDCEYGGEFKSIESIDASTVKFSLCYPDPAFPSKVAFSPFSILDKGHLEATGGDSVKISDESNGTGPYMLKEWKRGDSVTFEANPNYWGDKPAIQTVIFRWSEQSAQRLLELQSGTVDGIDNPAPEDFETIAADANLAIYDREALNVFYIGFNVDMAPFDNEKVREAFAMAVDRQRIVDEYYPEGSTVAIGFNPDAFTVGSSPDIPWYDYDPDAAKALLEEAGFDFSQEIPLSFRNVVRGYLPTPDKVAQELQAQFAEIGVNLKLNQMESATFIESTSAGQEAMHLLGWGADYPDASNFMDYHFANDNNQQFGTLFPDIVAEIRAAAKLSDPAARQVHYNKANELLKLHVPMIPVAHGGSATAFKAEVKGAHSSPLSNEVFHVMDNGKDTLVWMQSGEPAALWCSDETDGETLRACEQVYEALLAYSVGGVDVEPSLAESFEGNEDATEWTFKLRSGVKFHNGYSLDASDVVATYVAQWDASSPYHVGRTGVFEYFGAFYGSFLNATE